MCSAPRGRAEALKTARRGRSTKETSQGLPSEGGTLKNAPTPNSHHPQQINCPIITDMTAEESDADDELLPPTICLCVSSPKPSLSNYFPNRRLKQADGSSGRCQSPTGLTFISRRAGDVCKRNTNISEEAPLVHSGAVRHTSVHNNSVKCSLSSRVRWAKDTNGLVLSDKRGARKSKLGCHQRRFCSKPKHCQSSECLISWYKNQTDQSQSGSAARNTQDVSSLWSLSCALLHLSRDNRAIHSFSDPKSQSQFAPTEPSVFFRTGWEVIPKIWIWVCQNHKTSPAETCLKVIGQVGYGSGCLVLVSGLMKLRVVFFWRYRLFT